MQPEDDAPPAWFTDAQRGSFKLGDEVIVTLGECFVGGHHGEQEIGARGIVISLDEPGPHPILVAFRHPMRGVGRSWTYAAGELRPFDPLSLLS